MSRSSAPSQVRLQVEHLESRELLAGNILLNAYTGNLTIDGTAYADTARITTSGNSVKAELTFNGGTITRYYNAGQVRNLTFHGFEGDDRFFNDTVLNSMAFGGAGHDYLKGGSGYDRIYGGTGNDTLLGYGYVDHLFGMSGDDKIYGGNGDDALFGGAGSDWLQGDAGSNATDGLGTGVGGWATVAEEYVVSTKITAMEREIVNYTNIERERQGLQLLKISTKLTTACQYHAQNMADQEIMAHTLSGVAYGTLTSRLDWVGYDYRMAGENIAVNYEDAKAVVAGWMNSPGHRANILDASYSEIGVGIRNSNSGQPYYCQEFGSPW
jgi:cysteine-rich secretory family protein/hemolysin type calcium-binding protein